MLGALSDPWRAETLFCPCDAWAFSPGFGSLIGFSPKSTSVERVAASPTSVSNVAKLLTKGLPGGS